MNFNKIPFIYFAASMLLMTSCKTTKEIPVRKPYELKHWMTIEKQPCFGHCKVYNLSLYQNGLVILEGKEHLEKTGVYFTELSAEQIKKFKRLSSNLNWSGFKNEYMVNIQDLPITELQFFDSYGAKIKHIKANSNLPAAVHNIAVTLNELVATEKWTQIQRKNDMSNPEIIKNQFIVDMDSTLTAEDLQTEFRLYELKPINKISAFMNLWSFEFDDIKIGRYEMMILLRKKTGIRSVNFNRRLLPRE